MKFKPFHNLYFDATKGAFSKVTEREFYDSQITLTDVETDIVTNYFGINNILKGNVSSNPQKAAKSFSLYDKGKVIKLNLVFPKPHKAELRLYLSARADFKPKAGLIWFIYINKKNELVIGALEELMWNNLGQIDEEDEDYNSSIDLMLKPNLILEQDIEGVIVKKIIGSRIVYLRNPKLAALRFNLMSYKCEVNPQHRTFTSLKTELPFVEAHHFIPMKFQDLFLDDPLDRLDNIISLCPTCHRAFHHAVIDEKLKLISGIYDKRPELHKKHTFEDLAGYYNCIKL